MARKRPVEILEPQEVRAMIDVAGRGVTAVRNRALLALLAGAGLRIAEALALRPADVRFPERGPATVRVLHGKGDKARTTVLLADFAGYVRDWADERERLSLGPGGPFLATISRNNFGRPLQQSYVRQLLPRLAKRAGLQRRVHPHGLRHWFAYQLHVEARLPVAALQRLLGHSSLATTSVYLEGLSNLDAVALAADVRVWT